MLSRHIFVALGFVAASFAFAARADDDCKVQVPLGEPRFEHPSADLGLATDPEWVRLCRTGYAVAFNPKHNVADWVAFRLLRRDLLNPKVERSDNFASDPDVSDEHRVRPGDYLHSGFDRGHLASAASMKWSQDAMDDSFLMTNMAPQVGSGFNQHIWKALERRMRQWACVREELLIVTGPLYEISPIELVVVDEDDDGEDDNGVVLDVPSHFFKLAYDPKKSEAIAFLLPNKKLKTKDLPKFIRSIDEIESRSRLNFFPELDDLPEAIIEASVRTKLWPEPSEPKCKSLK